MNLFNNLITISMNESNWINLYIIVELIIIIIEYLFCLNYLPLPFSYFDVICLLGLFCFACGSFLLLLLIKYEFKIHGGTNLKKDSGIL